MYSALLKTILLLGVMGTVSCKHGDGSDESSLPDPHLSALELSSRIDRALEDNDPSRAMELIDSLNTTFPDELELRQKTINQKTRAIVLQVELDIPGADAGLEAVSNRLDSLEALFVNVAGDRIFDAYSVPRAMQGTGQAGTWVQPRLGDESRPWSLVATVKGKILGLDHISLMVGDEILAQARATDASQRVLVADGCEVLNFSPEESDPLGQWMNINPYRDGMKLRLGGRGGTTDIKLSPGTYRAIADTWLAADLRMQKREMAKKREILERKRVLAQSKL